MKMIPCEWVQVNPCYALLRVGSVYAAYVTEYDGNIIAGLEVRSFQRDATQFVSVEEAKAWVEERLGVRDWLRMIEAMEEQK